MMDDEEEDTWEKSIYLSSHPMLQPDSWIVGSLAVWLENIVEVGVSIFPGSRGSHVVLANLWCQPFIDGEEWLDLLVARTMSRAYERNCCRRQFPGAKPTHWICSCGSRIRSDFGIKGGEQSEIGEKQELY